MTQANPMLQADCVEPGASAFLNILTRLRAAAELAGKPNPVRDPYNPTADELRKWAYTPDAQEPEQDWDVIALRDCPYRKLIMEFAADRSCPNRRYFLHVLYLIAGDLFRTKVRPEEERRRDLKSFAEQVRTTGSFYLVRLAERIDALLAGEEPFDYDLWCAGKYAYDQPD
jgi:hypothetical protein